MAVALQAQPAPSLSGDDQSLLASLIAYVGSTSGVRVAAGDMDRDETGGVFVGAGDVNDDGRADVVAGSSSVVTVYSGQDVGLTSDGLPSSSLASFFYGPSFSGA